MVLLFGVQSYFYTGLRAIVSVNSTPSCKAFYTFPSFMDLVAIKDDPYNSTVILRPGKMQIPPITASHDQHYGEYVGGPKRQSHSKGFHKSSTRDSTLIMDTCKAKKLYVVLT